ncbi:MAG: hypothetical protein H0V70_25905 [Ktedonobacteraceae bacterium]|nr:hypothetical protein [Ktedonobacteraceae bacterium]
MTTQHTLASLKEALQQPFAPETIGFLPKDIHQKNGKTFCLALPYANKRVYEDRLNELVFGEWSTPYVPPFAQGNKLILPVTVVILGVAHTDYGEEYFTTTSKNGSTREDDNTATEAYSQAFRRACAQFLLGRYLYDLRKLELPYDSQSRQIAISKAERIARVEKLYQERGLIQPRSSSMTHSPVVQSRAKEPDVTAPVAVSQPLSPIQQTPLIQPETDPSPPDQGSQAALQQPTEYPKAVLLDWVARKVGRDPVRIQGICDYYHVARLTDLTARQRTDLSTRLKQQKAANAQPSATLQVTH